MATSLALALSGVAILNGLDLTLQFSITAAPDELAGIAVRAAGDVNGDGLGDILTYSVHTSGAGRVQVRSGLDRALLRSFPFVEHAFWAVPMAAAGDVDGDGLDDVLVGDAAQALAFVYSGATGAVLHTLSGVGGSPTDGFGRSVAGVGDVDGDGVGDLAVSAVPAFSDAGYVRVFSGAAGAHLYDVTSINTFGRFGTSLTGIGDVDGDGHADFAVGATSDGNRFLNPGAPPFIPPFWSNDQAGAVHAFSGASGARIWIATGDEALAGLGYRVAGAGDVNGDGVPDVVAGSASTEFPHRGYARVLSGVDGSELFTLLRNLMGSRSLVSVDGGSDLDGDGVADVLVGARAAPSPTEPDVLLISGATGQVAGSVFVVANHAANGGVRDVAFGSAGQGDVLVAGTNNAFGTGLTLGFSTSALGVPYCSAASNSTGFGARIRASGSLSVAANDVCLVVSPVPSGPGLFAYGSSPQQAPLGNGFLCIGGSIARLLATTSVGGALSHQLDLNAPPVPGAVIQPGSTWWFQAWYRDVPAGGSLSNLSNGLELSFVP